MLRRIGILYYRAHQASGNTAFVHALADAVQAQHGAVAVPIFCSSLRGAPDDLLALLATLDALIVTVLAAGGTKPATATAGGDDEAWDVTALAALDIPILQGLCLTWSREAWADSSEGLSPLDVATQVAVPEFDGRIITVPFSFKQTDADGLPRYVADPERCARVAGIAVAHARLRHVPPSQRKIADHAVGLPDQAFPDRQCGRPGYPGVRDPAVPGHAGGRLRPGAARWCRRAARPGAAGPDRRRGAGHHRRQRADPRADRGGRSGRGMADGGATLGQSGADPGRAVRRLAGEAAGRAVRPR